MKVDRLLVERLMKLSLLVQSLAAGGAMAQTPSAITFSVTYRDFLPAACFHIANNFTLANIDFTAWNFDVAPGEQGGFLPGSSFDDIQGRLMCDLFITNDANLASLFSRGIVSGHPDFESGNERYAEGVQCEQENPTRVPVASCVGEDGFSPAVSIVAPDISLSHRSGIPKPAYCLPGEEDRCGIINTDLDPTDFQVRTQTQKKWFDLWYNDDATYNKRVGQSLTLFSRNADNTLFAYDSNDDEIGNEVTEFGEDPTPGFFGPLFRFKSDPAFAADQFTAADNGAALRDAPAWPQSIPITDDLAADSPLRDLAFWMTTELHTTFEYREGGSLEFTFSGDDDFWAFINGKLAIDLGGIHSAEAATIDLNGEGVAEFLGLVDGEVYTLDIFHAERQTTESNFAITTAIFPACNVQQSGSTAFSFRDLRDRFSSAQELDDFFFRTRNIELPNLDSNSFTLVDGPFQSSFIYTESQENVGRGFDLRFNARVDGNADGFAVVFHNTPFDDFPVSGGANFNIKGLVNSFAIVFDLCADRDVRNTCAEQLVSVHYPDNSAQSNEASASTRRTNDNIVRNLKRDEFFPVEIIYYGGRPNFMEVFVNGSLYLRESDFPINQLLGGSLGARVGITGATSSAAATIEIQDYTLVTVEVEPSQSQLLFNSTEITVQDVVADGVSTTDGFSFQTSDFCGNNLVSGTLGNLVSAFYIELPQSTDGRMLQEFGENRTAPAIVPAVINDPEDGTYALQLQTTVVAQFALAFAFGAGCEVTVDEETGAVTLPTSDDCFSFDSEQVVTESTPVPIVPTPPPTEIPEEEEEEDFTVLVASIGGGVGCLGLVAASVLVFYKRKWDRQKRFIEEGNKYKLDMNANFQGADEYTATGTQLLKTQEEILKLQSEGKADPMTKEIEALRAANSNMKRQVQQTKERISVYAGDNGGPKKELPKKRIARKEL